MLNSDEALVSAVRGVLQSREVPATLLEIAEQLGQPAREIDRVLWGRPDQFVWQPGHCWSAADKKARRRQGPAVEAKDVRAAPMLPREPRELHAVTLANGLTLRVNRRPLDSDAVFSVRSSGNTIELTINSMHEVFAECPMPFDDQQPDGAGYKKLVEVMLEAWALHEDAAAESLRRPLQDTRLLWGRRTIEMLRDAH